MSLERHTVAQALGPGIWYAERANKNPEVDIVDESGDLAGRIRSLHENSRKDGLITNIVLPAELLSGLATEVSDDMFILLCGNVSGESAYIETAGCISYEGLDLYEAVAEIKDGLEEELGGKEVIGVYVPEVQPETLYEFLGPEYKIPFVLGGSVDIEEDEVHARLSAVSKNNNSEMFWVTSIQVR